jgi:hypothetical protein
LDWSIKVFWARKLGRIAPTSVIFKRFSWFMQHFVTESEAKISNPSAGLSFKALTKFQENCSYHQLTAPQVRQHTTVSVLALALFVSV